ncbi:Polynucleotidyl transferase- ribonuclease H-like superfamily protein [Striga hermonthica]|uniref:Polynucleotidyl transferase- ribonuclease H-like superfamily protein n=1 Tax=Striga hermonthica TaxID=68872 RepID=A0A9N7RQ88_STRHE|nr:Polynucleotidyl transferase- ribonuclease H-like superfamily protein [Striga hermonthica]
MAQRVRHFLWLALRDRLFTNMEQVRRHMAEDDACDFCGQPEWTIHVLRDCERAHNVWLRLVPSSCRRSFFSEDVTAWMWSNVMEHAAVGLEQWDTTFPIVCWRLWAWRNMAIFSNKVIPIETQIADIKGSSAQPPSTVGPPPAHTVRPPAHAGPAAVDLLLRRRFTCSPTSSVISSASPEMDTAQPRLDITPFKISALWWRKRHQWNDLTEMKLATA